MGKVVKTIIPGFSDTSRIEGLKGLYLGVDYSDSADLRSYGSFKDGKVVDWLYGFAQASYDGAATFPQYITMLSSGTPEASASQPSGTTAVSRGQIPIQYVGGYPIRTGTADGSNFIVTVDSGHSFQTGDTISFDATGLSVSGGASSGSIPNTVANATLTNCTVSGNTITFPQPSGSTLNGNITTIGNASTAGVIQSVQNPTFIIRIQYDGSEIVLEYQKPWCTQSTGSAIAVSNNPYHRTSSGYKFGLEQSGVATNLNKRSVKYGLGVFACYLQNRGTQKTVETATGIGTGVAMFVEDTPITVTFEGSLIGNEDKGDFSKDESPIGRSIISHDFITNKLIGN
jgi:hypothetical protein